MRKWRYVVAFVVGILLAGAALAAEGFSDAVTAVQRYRILCDAFTIPGTVLMLVGVLAWVAGEGLFDGVAYASRSLFRVFTRWEPVRYFDYLRGKQERRKKGGYGFLLITGGGFLLVAVVFYALFYGAY